MSEDPEKKSFMKDLVQGISVQKRAKDNFFSENEIKAKIAKAKKVRRPKPMIESNVLLEVARLAQMPKLTSVKNKQLLKDVHELRGWMEKGPDFCNYENAFAPWQRIQEVMNQAFLDGDMDVFSDFATAWNKWKKSPNFEKLTDDKFRDRHSDSIAVLLYRAMPCFPEAHKPSHPKSADMVTMISSMQNDLGRSPTQQEIFHKALEKYEDVNFDEGEVSRIVSNMKIRHLLSRE